MKHPTGPEHTAVRTALWRALHIQLDPKPHIFTDDIVACPVPRSLTGLEGSNPT